MTKKNVVYLIVFVVLLGAVGYFLWQENTGASSGMEVNSKEEYDFTISDTASIDKIIIEDKVPRSVSLERKNGQWYIGESKVRPDAIKTLLETFNRMEMRNFLPKKMQQTVIKRMTVYGKKVQVFKNGNLFKTIYVGTEAQDEMATYMMIEGASQPFAVSIPGFNGFLSTRFFTQEHLWKKRDIVSMNPYDIRSVSVRYPDSLEFSFELRQYAKDSVEVLRHDGTSIEDLDKVDVNLFLSTFKRLSYEAIVLETDKIYNKRDSITASQPVFEMKLVDNKGDITTLAGYRVPAATDYFDPEVEAPEWDPDKMYGFINDEKMVIIQYYGLRYLLVSSNYFSGKWSVEN